MRTIILIILASMLTACTIADRVQLRKEWPEIPCDADNCGKAPK